MKLQHCQDTSQPGGVNGGVAYVCSLEDMVKLFDEESGRIEVIVVDVRGELESGTTEGSGLERDGVKKK